MVDIFGDFLKTKLNVNPDVFGMFVLLYSILQQEIKKIITYELKSRKLKFHKLCAKKLAFS